MSRICPKCKVKLGGYDRFFCTSCGEPLPTDLVNRDWIFSRIANFATSSKEKSESKSKFNFNSVVDRLKIFVNVKSIVAAIFSVFFTVGFSYFIQYKLDKNLFNGQDVANKITGAPVEYSKNVVEVPLNWEVNTFGIDSIMEFVPFDSDIVIEGNDLTKFGAAYSEIDPVYKNLATFINGRAEQHFVFFAKDINGEYAWSLIYFPLKPDFSISGDLVTKYTWLKFWKNDPIALVTTQESILSEVSDTKGKTVKNFTQRPIYASTHATSPKNGKLFIYLTNQKAKDYFLTLKTLQKLPKDLQMVVESVGKTNSDYSIIL